MGITLTHFLSLIVMRCSFLDSIYSSFLPPSLSSSINRMRDLFSNLETVSTDLRRKLPDRWIVNAKLVAYSADQILCKLQQLLLDKDAAMASNLLGSSEIDDEINWVIRVLEELLVSGEIKIGYSGVLVDINPGLSEQEVGKLLYSSNPSQPWSEKYKLLMKPSVLMDVPESVNVFFNPIYNRRLRQASPFTLITSLHLSGLSGSVELPRLPVLQSLRISVCERLNAVSICEKLSAVEALEISCCPELTSLAGLNQLLSLRSLSLSFCFNLQFDLNVQLPPLLEYLDLTHCPSLEEWCKNAGLQNWKLDETIESFQRSSPVGDSPVYGRENEKNSIIEFLLSDDINRSNLTVVCIVGESGIGKTSLAHLIYSEARVLDSFDARMFITMTEKSDETRLINKLIESVTGSPCPMTEAELLEELLIDELSGTKVFIVLDDAENENPCFWSRIVTILNHSTRGSVLLVTTESKDVAEVIGAMQTYYLDPLSDYYCWKIFCQHIFTGLSTNANTDLVETGKQLLSKCQHNPLCIKVLAGLFVCSKNEESWAEILKTDLWDMDGFDGDTLPTLRVGYELLPNKLKKCVHYCSLFPKDYVFAKQQIVYMWMSQGFIFPVEGRQPEEDGFQNFDELLLRGFFQHSPLHDVEEEKFIMHDLIYALATNLSGNECPPTEGALERIFENCFHFSLNPSKIQIDKMKPLIKEASDLESFLALTTSSFQIRINFSILEISSLSDLFTKCINLRTLDLSCTDIVELPGSVGMLKQLRYLCVNNTKIRSIPRELCSLVNLQTLEAKDCQHLVELPETMMELKNLRHLDVSKKSGCVKMMIGIGQLINLQSLAVFCVGCEMPYCSIQELKDLNCLSSSLQIAGLENVTNGLDAKEAALHNKVHLNTLWLHWNDNKTFTESEGSVTISEKVLNNLKPNPKIGELIIRNYRGNLFPTWMGDPSFTKLVSIILDNCLNCSQFPALGGLPSLRHLSVQKLYHLVRLENTESQFVSKNTPRFPSLETLNLWEMYDLEELFETSDRDFPCLLTLSISRCPMLKRVPCFSSLLNLSLYCCVKLPHLPDFPSLESLRIDGFQKLKSLELPKDLPALKELEIRHCNELLLVKRLRKLPSLEKLNVVHCPKFDSLKNWKPCHSKPIRTTRWFFQKEKSTTQMEHQETSEPAEKHTEVVVMDSLDDSKKCTIVLKTAELAEKRTKALKNWLFCPKEKSTTQMEHQETSEPAENSPMEKVSEDTVITEFKQNSQIISFEPIIRSGEWSDIGRRYYMEDTHVCISDLAKNYGYNSIIEETISFYGVFDGHGGKDAALFVRDNLPKVIVEDADFPLELEKVVTRSFVQIDNQFAETCSLQSALSSGTTALTAMIFGRSLLVANAGDSRAVLSRYGSAVEMSRDHRPSCTRERKRVESLGGYVDDGYLNGQLSVTRALGDWHLEGMKNQNQADSSVGPSPGPLTAEPELKLITLTKEDEFLIIACDGIWDVFSNQYAVDFIRRRLQEHNDVKLCCKEIVEEAIRLGATDNLTAVLVCFHLEPPPVLQVRRSGRVMRSTSFESLHSLQLLLEGK